MLCWAREYRSRFFEQFLPKAMAAKSQQEADAKEIIEEELAVEEIRDILAQTVKHSKERAAAAAMEAGDDESVFDQ